MEHADVDSPFLVSADRSVASLTDPHAISVSTHAVNAALAQRLAAMTPLDGLGAMREAAPSNQMHLPVMSSG